VAHQHAEGRLQPTLYSKLRIILNYIPFVTFLIKTTYKEQVTNTYNQMSKVKDVFIKDEGDFVTVGFDSELSQSILKKEKADVLKHVVWGTNFDEKPIAKLDIQKESIPMIQAWLVSHNLSWETDV